MPFQGNEILATISRRDNFLLQTILKIFLKEKCQNSNQNYLACAGINKYSEREKITISEAKFQRQELGVVNVKRRATGIVSNFCQNFQIDRKIFRAWIIQKLEWTISIIFQELWIYCCILTAWISFAPEEQSIFLKLFGQRP